MLRIIKAFCLALLAAVVCCAVSARAWDGSVSPPRRGEGMGAISGYTVSQLHYRLAEDPALLEAVSFVLDGPAGQALVSFSPGQGPAFPCRQAAALHWECPLEGVAVREVTEIYLSAGN
jgi:hypothetical protein